MTIYVYNVETKEITEIKYNNVTDLVAFENELDEMYNDLWNYDKALLKGYMQEVEI